MPTLGKTKEFKELESGQLLELAENGWAFHRYFLYDGNDFRALCGTRQLKCSLTHYHGEISGTFEVCRVEAARTGKYNWYSVGDHPIEGVLLQAGIQIGTIRVEKDSKKWVVVKCDSDEVTLCSASPRTMEELSPALIKLNDTPLISIECHVADSMLIKKTRALAKRFEALNSNSVGFWQKMRQWLRIELMMTYSHFGMAEERMNELSQRQLCLVGAALFFYQVEIHPLRLSTSSG